MSSPAPPKQGFFGALGSGLRKTADRLGAGVASLFAAGAVDKTQIQNLRSLLLSADIGPSLTDELCRLVEKRARGDRTDIRELLAEHAAALLRPLELPENDFFPRPNVGESGPWVMMACGVNGSGKTTTLGKLAWKMRTRGLNVGLIAADTYRAAATEQLHIWAERADCPCFGLDAGGGDPGALVFDALTQARRLGLHGVLIDTAGRLQNNRGLMDELAKIARVSAKVVTDAPHRTVIVLDGTVGQNALNQVEQFQKIASVDAMIVTKLDGTSKAGVVLALARAHGLPIPFVGLGERLGDLQPFVASHFAHALLGLDNKVSPASLHGSPDQGTHTLLPKDKTGRTKENNVL